MRGEACVLALAGPRARGHNHPERGDSIIYDVARATLTMDVSGSSTCKLVSSPAMSVPTPPRTVALAFQARYQCGHSGACCTAGWPIPVDPGRAAAVRASIGEAHVLAPGVLSKDPSGACSLYDAVNRRCRVHTRLGPRALPISCAHFPRRLVVEDDRIAISLSHFCPTVAGLLFDSTAEAAVVETPSLLEGIEPEGLDARGAWPPLLRPGMLADLESYRLWEAAAAQALASAEGGPEAALARVVAMTDAVTRWNPGNGSLKDRVAEQAALLAGGPSGKDTSGHDWRGLERAVGRYLAAKAFANWGAYQGDGLHAVVQSVAGALDVLREEAAAACARAASPLDRPLLIEAVRQADLRIMHANG